MLYLHKQNAVVAQLVEHGLPKPRVAGSNPVYRSFPLATHIKQGKTSTRSLSLFIILYELNHHDEKALSSGSISNVLIDKNSWRAGGYSTTLMGHYIKNHAVCLLHTFGTYEGKIADTTIYIIFDKTFHIGNIFILYCKHGTEHSSRNTTGYL